MNKKIDRTIFIGDIHGCLTELKELLKILATTEDDRIIMLGDLINRGPHQAEAVRFVRDSGFECLMGNHEYEYLNEYKIVPKYGQLYEELGEELHQWITERPYYIEERDFIAVHAGLEPGKHPSQSRPEVILNIRTWDGEGKNLKNLNNPPWYKFYTGAKKVFYGHWATRGVKIRENTIGLDSGCVYGRKLSAYILEEERLVQLDANGQHYIPPSLRKKIS